MFRVLKRMKRGREGEGAREGGCLPFEQEGLV